MMLVSEEYTQFRAHRGALGRQAEHPVIHVCHGFQTAIAC